MTQDPAFGQLADVAKRDTGRCSYLMIEAAAQRPAPPPPLFLLGPGEHLRGELIRDAPMPEIGCYTLHDARLGFDGFLLQGETFLECPMLNCTAPHMRSALAGNVPAWREFPVRRVAGMAALLHGPGFRIYGHWLVDFLPKLWVLRRLGYDLRLLHYVMPRGLPPFITTLLESFEISAEQFIFYDQRAEFLEVECLLAPTLLRLGNRVSTLLPSSVKFWRDSASRVTACEPPPVHESVYVSRRFHRSERELIEREAIERVAEQMGYMLVRPESWTIAQQMAIFGAASRIAGEYGSGLHNSIFAPKDTRICALRGTSAHPGFLQTGLADCCGQAIGYVFGETPLQATEQRISIAPDLAKEAFAQLAED